MRADDADDPRTVSAPLSDRLPHTGHWLAMALAPTGQEVPFPLRHLHLNVHLPGTFQ